MKDLQDAWEVITEAFGGLARTLKEILCEVFEAIEHIEKEEEFRQSWHVPRNITLNHQVLNRKPLLSNIRNSI